MNKFYLLNDIQFNSDYRHVIDFDNEQQQIEYFNNRRVLGYNSDVTYIRGERGSIRVEIPQIVVENYSYFTYTNFTPSGEEKTYYAFIDGVNYVDPSTSQIFFTIDVWQTYLFDHEIKDAFIDREHQDRFTHNVSTNTYKPIYNIELENIDVGDEYEVSTERNIYTDLARHIDGNEHEHSQIYWVEIVAMKDLNNSPAELPYMHGDIGVQLPFYLYYIPMIRAGYEVARNTEFFIEHGNEETKLTNIYSSYTELAENPNIVSMRAIYYTPFKYNIKWNSSNALKFVLQIVGDTIMHVIPSTMDGVSGALLNMVTSSVPSRINYNEINTPINYNITGLENAPRRIENETKLYQYPYEFHHITNYIDEGLIIKRQYIEAVEWVLDYNRTTGFESTFRLSLRGYLGDTRGNQTGNVQTKSGDLPLTTNPYQEYMATRKATATTGMALNVASVGVGLGVSALGHPLMGAGMMMTGINSIKNELVLQQDLKHSPNKMSNAGNDGLYNLVNGNLMYKCVKKSIHETQKRKLYEYFYRFGYKANSFGVPELRTRFYFNYIKTLEVSIGGNINNTVKEELTRIYNEGTTIWHVRYNNLNPTIYNYEFENIEMSVR